MFNYAETNPTPERDAHFRAIAEQCYNRLLAWLASHNIVEHSQLILLNYNDGRHRSVVALPWIKVNPLARQIEHPLHNFVIYFGITNPLWSEQLGSFGPTQQGEITISLHHILDDYKDINNLPHKLQDYRVKSTFIHEFIHLLDYLRKKGKHRGTHDLLKRSYGTYVTSPLEFNAHYQQGFHALDTYFHNKLGTLTPLSAQNYIEQHPQFKGRVEDKIIDVEHILSWDFVRFNLEKFWVPSFIYHLRQEKKSWNKFLKRVRLDVEAWRAKHLDNIERLWETIKDEEIDSGQPQKNPLDISEFQRNVWIDEKITFVAKMKPEDFIFLTEGPVEDWETSKETIMGTAKSLSFYNDLTAANKIVLAPFLQIDINPSNLLEGKIVGHEARHRAAALIKNDEHIMEVGIKITRKYGSRSYSFLDCPVFWKAQFREREVDARNILIEIKEANIQQQYQRQPVIENISLDKNEIIKILTNKVDNLPRTNPKYKPNLIIVDIQPEYQKNIPFEIYKFTNFLNQNYPNYQSIHYLYNGKQTLDMISEGDLKSWLVENDLQEETLNKIKFFDKGYAFFRYCIDSGVADEETVALIRKMFKTGINDSRELDELFWKRFPHTHIKSRLQLSQEMINIPDLMWRLEDIQGPIILMGGSMTECLKEVELALMALKKKYKIEREWSY